MSRSLGLREDQQVRARLVARIVALFPPPPNVQFKPVAGSATSKAFG